jgi:hypothetical protein
MGPVTHRQPPAQPVQPVDHHYVEASGLGVGQHSPALFPLLQGDRAADTVVHVLVHHVPAFLNLGALAQLAKLNLDGAPFLLLVG